MQNISSQPVVSVVIPVYNTKSYLIECMDSILVQTLSNIEIICIDDGSIDGSSDILEKYAAQDNRVHLILQPHQGAGIARNVGLEIAQGKYIIFLDSDDFFVPEMLECVYKSAQENQSDIVLFNGYQYDDKKQEIIKEGTFLNESLIPNKPVFSWLDVPDYIFNLSLNAPWCRLYSRKFLLETGLHFSIQQNSEDVCFTILSLALAQRISIVHENLIYYRIGRPNSLQYSNHENPICFLKEYETIYHELIQRDLYVPLQTAFRFQMISSILYRLKSTKTDQSRLQILDALDTEPYCNLPLKEVPGVDDGNKEIHNLSHQLIAVQTQYHKSLNALVARERFDKLIQESKADSSIKVSVIIPVYNTQAYLDETLASVTDQTLKDIEIICINDGSTDGSLDILNRWAANDDRLIIISQPNMGQGYARNVGISRARGKYIYFIDSDDLLEREALEQLTVIMDEKQLDSLYFDAGVLFEDIELEENYSSYRNQYIRTYTYDDIYDGQTLMRLFCEAGEYQISPCLQIYRLDLIQAYNIRFPIGILHEDNVFTFAAMLYAKRVSHIQHSYYLRRIRHDSVMTVNSSFQNVYGRYSSFWEMLHIYYAISSEIDEINRTAVLNRIINVLEVARQIYGKLTNEEKYGRFGLIENLALFNSLIGESDTNKVVIQKLNDRVSDLSAKLKEANTKRAEFFTSLKQAREANADLSAKLKEANTKRAEFYTLLKQTHKEKADLSAKLKKSDIENDTLNSSLKHVLEQKTELSHKLQVVNQENISYVTQIIELQKTVDMQNNALDAIRNSWTYHIGRFFTWPVRKIRMIRNN